MDLLTSVDPTGSGTVSADPYRPSFFELAAQDQLRDLLQPALRYVLSVLAQRNPRYLLRIVNRFDEVYALLMWAVERHYLKTWGSSFAENFYGLRRRRRPGVSTDRARAASSRSTASYEQLRSREIIGSLIFLVGLPYIQAKAKDYWERIGGGVDDGALFGDEEEHDREQGGPRRPMLRLDESQEKPLERIKRLLQLSFRRGYPYAGAASQLWLLSYNVRYLFDRTPYWRPWLAFMRVDVRRMAAEDYPPQPPLLPPGLPSPLRSPSTFALALLRASPFIFFEALKYALPASIFFFKFLEWWYSADNPRRRRGGGSGSRGGADGTQEDGLPLFGPPRVLLPHEEGVLQKPPKSWRDPGVPTAPQPLGGADSETSATSEKEVSPSRKMLHNGCPLCGVAPINNPCVLPTGYVFCYKCAYEYIEQYGRCPVTLRAVPGTAELRKVLG